MAMEDLIIPDVPEPLVGYRAWKLGENGTLKSPIYRGSKGHVDVNEIRRNIAGDIYGTDGWPFKRTLVAECGHCEVVPSPHGQCESVAGHGCGLYAHSTLDGLPANQGRGVVQGEVWMWGRVYEYTKGFRAEFAYPKRLFIPEDSPVAPLVDIAADAYGIPVMRVKHLSWGTVPHSQEDDEIRARLIDRVKRAHDLD